MFRREAYSLLSITGKCDCADQHYETYLTIGVYYELENEYEKSLKYYKKSLSIINRDPKLDLSEDPWKDLIEEIPQHIERVESKI